MCRACYHPGGFAQFLLTVMWVMLAAGCGGDAPFDIVPISGEVAYEDGAPVPGMVISVTFVSQADPLSAKVHPRPAFATVNAEDGIFPVVTTWKYGDGAIRGRHKVTVTSLGPDNNPTGAVPEIYASPTTTPLQVEVTKRNQHFQLKIRRPQ